VHRAFRRLEAPPAVGAKPVRITRTASGSRRLANTSATTLLGILAHDLKNPISGILAASQFLLEDAVPLLDQHQSAMLRSIETSSELALTFIEDVLELHSMGSGEQKLRLHPTDAGALVSQCAGAHRQRAASRQIALEVSVETPAPLVNADRRRLAQCINAILRDQLERVAPGGRIEVAVASRKNDVAIAVSAPGARPVRDGAKAFLEKIRYAPSKRRLDEIRTALTFGAVKRIIEAHHGSVRKEERSGAGARCTILIPAAAPEHAMKHGARG